MHSCKQLPPGRKALRSILGLDISTFSMGNTYPNSLSDVFPFFPGNIALVAHGHSLMNCVTRILCCFKLGSPELTTGALPLFPWCIVWHFQHVNFSQFLLFASALYYWCLSTVHNQYILIHRVLKGCQYSPAYIVITKRAGQDLYIIDVLRKHNWEPTAAKRLC